MATLLFGLLAMGMSGANAGAAPQASVAVSKTDVAVTGETVTVTGTGFDPAAHQGTRPPLAGQNSGVYVVFGTFDQPWAPSEGAPGSARRVIKQVWALPAAQRAILDPAGTSPDFVTIAADGSFTVDLEVAPVSGSVGDYGIVTYAGSGAVDADQETFTPITFSDPGTTTSTTTSTTTPASTTAPTSTTRPPSTTAPSTTRPPTTNAPSTTTPSTAPPTTSDPLVREARSAKGASGQSLSVDPATGLNPEGDTTKVTGSGYDTEVGIYVALCVDNGPDVAPEPCVGGGGPDAASSVWISSNPPSYAAGLAQPFGPNGTFEVDLELAAADDYVDCLEVRCAVVTKADHTASANRSADARVPVSWAGQDPAETEQPVPTTAPTTKPGGGGSTTPTTPKPGDPPATSAPLVREPRTTKGASGQSLTVDPATGLDPDGDTVKVAGSGYDPKLGIYVALCVDNGPGVTPGPCLGGGGPETDADGGGSVWISSNPPAYGVDLAEPFGPDGTFEVDLNVVAADEFVDCLEVRCAVVTKADHTASADRSADARVPVSWAGQDPAESEQPVSTKSIPGAGAGGTPVTTLTVTPNTAAVATPNAATAVAPKVAGATQLGAVSSGASPTTLASTGASARLLVLAAAALILAGITGRILSRRVRNS